MLTEQIRIHENFGTGALVPPRKITVYLPPGYTEDEGRRYPVLYMHDGQNLFDPATAVTGVPWAADEAAQIAIHEGRVEPLIIVGIDNAGPGRIDEYTPIKADRGKMRGHGGGADRYGRMIVEELKPFIDLEYRTKPEREFTGMGGSSLGALVTMYLGITHPEVFSRLAVMSPSAWWARNHIIREAAKLDGRIPLRIWLDIGKREGSTIKHQVRALKEMLLANGWKTGQDLAYFEIPDARHDEAAWAARFGSVLAFLFPVL
jgi:predicted alpha/beta superfamily hydrolase